jgi:hypothetical protein
MEITMGSLPSAGIYSLDLVETNRNNKEVLDQLVLSNLRDRLLKEILLSLILMEEYLIPHRQLRLRNIQISKN